MNTTLLSCLRLAGDRLRPALVIEQKKRPIWCKFLNPLRIFIGLSILPLVIDRQKRVYLHGSASITSKSGIALRELIEAGVPQKVIYINNNAKISLPTKALRIICRFPAAVIILWRLRKRLRKLDSIDCRLLLAREVVRVKLYSRPLFAPLIISDVSPDLNVLWSAAASVGNRALWWQDDFHHGGPLPYDIQGGVVLNASGLDAVRCRSDKAGIAVRRGREPVPIKKIAKMPIVGVATNNSFIASDEQVDRLASIARHLGINSVELRLHPNSSVAVSCISNPSIRICDRNETMAEFSKRIDLCIVGNSASQIWLVKNGVPVVHISGLDTNGYDLYGYVSKGLVLGLRQDDLLNIDRVETFYVCNKETHLTKMKDYTVLDSKHADSSVRHLTLESQGWNCVPCSGS